MAISDQATGLIAGLLVRNGTNVPSPASLAKFGSLPSFINLLTIWPLVMVAFVVTMNIGVFIHGPEYQVQRHEGLKTLAEYPQLAPRILVTIVAVIVAPLLEELLFRGLFQTMIRSIILRPWTSILLSSVIFTAVHADSSHWPALFVLAICLGYAYEKTGSLLRPIFIHSIFNTCAIVATMIQ